MNSSRLLISIAALLVFGAAVLAWPLDFFEGKSSEYEFLEPHLDTEENRGIAYFTFGDFSALSSETLQVSASPWKLATAALALEEQDGDIGKVADTDINAVFRRFGFHFPKSFGNWPADLQQPEITYPVGQNVGFAGRSFPPIGATIGNVGCAACHSSVMYDADGLPDLDRVWLGMPNGSINLEAYTSTLFEALVKWTASSDELLAAVEALYPESDWRELLTLRYFVLPQVSEVVSRRQVSTGRLIPFRSSLAGATNGLDSLKNRLGMIPEGSVIEDSIFNSVPDLGGRLWRTKLLNSGTYTIPGFDHDRVIRRADITSIHRRNLAAIVAYFTVPSMGVTPEVAETSIGPATAITEWMMEYRPQPFPGEIDRSLLQDGRLVYAANCASCHGTYDDDLAEPQLTSFPNWEGDVGTDPQRANLLTQEIADAVNASYYGKYIAARSVKTYTAPPLTGIWASAPYFHNGSVPTLWHLMNPETRPGKFFVGGHKMDLTRVGIAGQATSQGDWAMPEGYQPWSEPAQVDTSAFGLDNGGHEKEFNLLNDQQKRALLEYLKIL